MPSLGIAVAALFAAVCAWVVASLLIRAAQRRRETLDDTLGGLRKVHKVPIPRIGGVAVALGLVAGAVLEWLISERLTLWLLFVCVAPAFVWGLIEDLSKRGAVLPRLVLPAVAGALGFVLLDARITELDVVGLDKLLAMHSFAFLFTLFAVTGVTHAVNVIDGLNGLAGFSSFIAAIGLAVVARAVGDPLVFSAACVLAASIGGFLLLNFPSGRIFLGDGGAYLVGLMLAELSVLLVHRNSQVSPWFPLVLLAYPIWETLFSMYRRQMRGHSSAHADALHLHTLLYRRVVRWRGYAARPADEVARNSLTSVLLWPVPAVTFAVALHFWADSTALQIAAAVFALAYLLAYRLITRFRVPAWLVIRAKAASSPRRSGDELADVTSRPSR